MVVMKTGVCRPLMKIIRIDMTAVCSMKWQYLYAVELENYNYMLEHTGPFTNLPPSGSGGEWIEPWYWTGTLDSLDPTRAWRFDFTCG